MQMVQNHSTLGIIIVRYILIYIIDAKTNLNKIHEKIENKTHCGNYKTWPETKVSVLR